MGEGLDGVREVLLQEVGPVGGEGQVAGVAGEHLQSAELSSLGGGSVMMLLLLFASPIGSHISDSTRAAPGNYGQLTLKVRLG